MSQFKDMNVPLVSVCMITYNHEDYIAEAIESVVSQETNFPIKLMIGEDYSSDKTREICEKYERIYPHIIELLPKENGNLGMMNNFIKTLDACNGKYIAVCEGDDFWTDKKKLQKQVNFLDNNEKLSLVFTNRFILNVADNKISKHIIANKKNGYSLNDVIGGFVPSTQTILFRNDKNLISFLKKYPSHPSGDQLVALYYGTKGNFYLMDDFTATYRITGDGAWSGRMDNRQYSLSIYYENFRTILKLEGVYRKFPFYTGLGRKLMTFYGFWRWIFNANEIQFGIKVFSVSCFVFNKVLNK